MPEVQPATVMLVDDHEIVRDGLREVLERTGEFEVVGEASDGVEAVDVAVSQRPDVIVMDLIMPVKGGVDACREIMERVPETKVLVLTMSNEQDAVLESLAAGATGYLQKTHGRAVFLDTIRDVAAGEYRIPSDSLRRVLAGIRNAPPPVVQGPALEELSARERGMLSLFVQGRTYAEIAEIRGLQAVTVRNAIYGIQRKLEFSNKQELVVWAVRQGLLGDAPEVS